MDEPPRSGIPRHRNSLPALLVAAFVCLCDIAVFEALADKSTVSPCNSPSQSESHLKNDSSASCDTNTPDSSPPVILLRKRGHHKDPDLAWLRALKQRHPHPKSQPISPPGRSHRLIAKFVDPLEARANPQGTLTVTESAPGQIASLSALAESLKLRFRPLQSAPEESLAALRKRAALRSGNQQPDPGSLVEVITKNSSPRTIRTAARALLALDAVEYVEIESADAPPPPPTADIYPTSPSLVSYQEYRRPSEGIGIDYVWDTYGIQGHPSLRITDCEYSFNPSHEDLDGLVTLQDGVTSMYSNYGDDHGTAAIGIIAAGDNGYGMSGAIQGSQVHFYPEYASMEWGTQYRTSAVMAAIAASAPGDIVMLEMQTYAHGGYGPAEYSTSVWNAVKMGTDAGVIIIAAAGNGDQDLDSSEWADYRNRGDSGAILVGAGYSSRSRINYSTHGSRVNLQGWGNGVATTGYGSLTTCGDDPNQKYTSSFNGTSSATPMVASAAALLQSVSISKLGIRLSPEEMRSLLIASGSPQTGSTYKQIGPLPDLTAAVPQLLASEFASSTPISIPDFGDASPNPSTIPVSGVSGMLSAVRVRLNNLNHSDPRNLDIMLVSPSGKVAALMSDAGSYYSVTNASLMFDDAAPTVIPESFAISPGRYRPANYGSPGEIPPPGTTGTIGENLNALAADGINGEWKLYVTDDHEGGSGSLGSWSVSFETTPLPNVDFTSESQETPENGNPLALTATLSEACTVDVTVPFTLSGSASAPADYSISADSIFIPAGQTTGSVTITLTDDCLDEGDETISLQMAPPANGNPGAITTHTITIHDNDVTLAVASDYGDPTPGTAGEVVTVDTEITASVTSPIDQGSTRHVCSGWSGTGSAPVEGTTTSATFSIHQNSSITWRWKTLYHLDIQTSANGSVDEGGGWCQQGALRSLTAMPAPGHHFADWTVTSGSIFEGTPHDPQIVVRLDEPTSLIANFAINTYTLNYAAGPDGTLSGSTTQLVDHGSDGTAIAAIPASGYEFIAWSDGSTDNPRIDTGVTTGIDLTANFLKIPTGKILVEISPESPVENGSTVEFGSRVTGTSPVIQSFTIHNTGDAPLTGIMLTLDGPGSSAFSTGGTTSSASIEPGTHTSFSVIFTPLVEGSHPATLSIASSDPDASPFQLLLSGNAKTAVQAYNEWLDAEGLSNPTPPPSPSAHRAGDSLLLKYAFNVNGSTIPSTLVPGTGTSGLPCLGCGRSTSESVFRLEYIRRKDSGLNYRALQMQGLENGTRAPMEGSMTTTSIDPDWERVVIEQTIDPLAPARFFTVEVTLPDEP